MVRVQRCVVRCTVSWTLRADTTLLADAFTHLPLNYHTWLIHALNGNVRVLARHGKTVASKRLPLLFTTTLPHTADGCVAHGAYHDGSAAR
jgi:hypothetical protein